MPPNQPPGAKLAIWKNDVSNTVIGNLRNRIGLGHAGLDVHGICNHVYVTWAPANSPGFVKQLFTNAVANKKCGFQNLKNRHNGIEGLNNKNVALPVLERIEGRLRNAQGEVVRPHGWEGPFSLESETAQFRSVPDFQIPIIGQDVLDARTTGPAWGIQCDVICRWWIQMLQLPPDSPQRQFNFHAKMHDTAKNCAAMVAKALHVGGLANYAPPPTNIWSQGMVTLRKWAERANQRIAFLNTQRQVLMASEEWNHIDSYIGPQPFDFMGACELPTLDEWKRMSKVKSSFRTGLARRHEQIAEIDRLLVQYHHARAVEHELNPIDDENYFEDTEELLENTSSWVNLMASIQEQCFFHLTTKPRSDRRFAVVQLAKLINNALRGNTRFHQERLRAQNAPADATYQQSLQSARDSLEASLVLEHPDLIESAVYENIDRFGNPLLDASGSYEVPPDATSSGRYENLTDSLRPIENSSSGVYDYPAELDRQPFRRRVVGNASSLSRPQSPKPAKVSRFLGRTI